jgi:hypothetical protein
MTVTATVTVTDARDVMHSGKRLGDYFGRLSDKRVRQAMEGAQGELQVPAPKPKYPIKWDSERQRRAFFATGGFGRGIPTKRTGEYIGGFRVVKKELRSYSLVNRVPYTKYVGGNAYGKRQSRIHENRWKKIQIAVRTWGETLMRATREDVRRVIRNEAVGL